jgi:hypothetical protein
MTERVDEIATSHKTLLAMTERVDEIATSHKTLLAMTEQKVEIATSSNQKPVGLLAIRLCHNYSVNYLPPLMLIFYSNIGNR